MNRSWLVEMVGSRRLYLDVGREHGEFKTFSVADSEVRWSEMTKTWEERWAGVRSCRVL